ncbi:hypothetical protein [Paenibacillus agricola]|uniref:Uncharacterized protein n=1 Tax=Paenibacillus agricola TaxID=2716264 RepID=A0ABX0JJT5_9BACL|nr:hypothetical protein [Paenibacillus agricola]NHN34809.1 hypothetical protein [Paenibacillus agricola]
MVQTKAKLVSYATVLQEITQQVRLLDDVHQRNIQSFEIKMNKYDLLSEKMDETIKEQKILIESLVKSTA